MPRRDEPWCAESVLRWSEQAQAAQQMGKAEANQHHDERDWVPDDQDNQHRKREADSQRRSCWASAETLLERGLLLY